MHKAFTGLAMAAAVAVAVTATTSPSEARWRGHGWGWGPGIVGGLAAGALIGGALAPRYYGPGPYYSYGAGPYAYGECYRRRIWTEYGWRWRRVCY
jgi:MFS family permease